MNLIIDTGNGIAGDIVSSGLISLGADQDRMLEAMTLVGSKLGTVNISKTVHRRAVQLQINLKPDSAHLTESQARFYLDQVSDELGLERRYRVLAFSILDKLCTAERYVHSHDPRLRHMLSHHKSVVPGKGGTEAVLHEAQDILIDIAGFATGSSLLEIGKFFYTDKLNVGNGKISFSHGTFDVPAPATKYILEKAKIPWERSKIYSMEMTTPTGAAVLSGSGAKMLKFEKNSKFSESNPQEADIPCKVMVNESGKVMENKSEKIMVNESGKVMVNESGKVTVNESGKVMVNESGKIMEKESGKIMEKRLGKLMAKGLAKGTKPGLPDVEFYLVR